MKMFKKSSLIICGVIAVFIAMTVVDVFDPTWGFFSKVETGNVGVLSIFGKVEETPLEPGFHVKNWFAHVNSINTQTRKMTGDLTAFSSDIQQVDINVTLNFNVDKVNAVTLFKEIGSGYEQTIIQPRLVEATKIVMSRYTAEAIISNREKLSTEVLEIVREDLTPYGINATAVAIENIDFTDAFTNAVEAKQVATQQKLTAQTEQDRLTMQAKAEASRKKIEAEAAAEVAKINADAEAYAITAKAEAEAKANAEIAASVTQELINYNKIQRWDGQLPTITGGATPILDLTMDDVNGSN